jgi:excinuclease ABC subunit B
VRSHHQEGFGKEEHGMTQRPKAASRPFRVVSDYTPAGDQPQAIAQLVEAINSGEKAITLLGATGTGKTFTMAKVVEQVQRPT